MPFPTFALGVKSDDLVRKESSRPLHNGAFFSCKSLGVPSLEFVLTEQFTTSSPCLHLKQFFYPSPHLQRKSRVAAEGEIATQTTPSVAAPLGYAVHTPLGHSHVTRLCRVIAEQNPRAVASADIPRTWVTRAEVIAILVGLPIWGGEPGHLC